MALAFSIQGFHTTVSGRFALLIRMSTRVWADEWSSLVGSRDVATLYTVHGSSAPT